jgi:predicted dehydrogenase
MTKVRIGFAGVGFMGQIAHLRNYVRIPECEVVAIAEPRQELARTVAAKYGIERIYKNHRELAEDPDVEAVVASQPHLMNGYIVIPLLKAGKHVFVEKPMAGSLAEAEEMVAAASNAGVKLMVGFMKRYDRGVNLSKERLDGVYANGQLGATQLVNAWCMGGDWLRNVERPIMTDEAVPPQPDFEPRNPDWMSPSRQATFNTYMNIFAHNLNLARYLFPQKLTVRGALLREGMLNQTTHLESGGVLVNLYGVSVHSEWWLERTEVYFERGWVRVDTPSPMSEQDAAQVEVYNGETRTTEILNGEPCWAFRAQAEHFIDCVANDRIPRSNGEDCLEDMRLMEDVFRKAEWV